MGGSRSWQSPGSEPSPLASRSPLAPALLPVKAKPRRDSRGRRSPLSAPRPGFTHVKRPPRAALPRGTRGTETSAASANGSPGRTTVSCRTPLLQQLPSWLERRGFRLPTTERTHLHHASPSRRPSPPGRQAFLAPGPRRALHPWARGRVGSGRGARVRRPSGTLRSGPHFTGGFRGSRPAPGAAGTAKGGAAPPRARTDRSQGEGAAT